MQVDQLYTNGSIYTMKAEGDKAEALAVRDGRIVFVGSAKEAGEKVKAAHVIDLEGRTMIPGLSDSHLHFFAYCQSLTTVDLGSAKSKAEAIDLLRKKAANTPEGEWIRGANFDQSKWSDAHDRIPTREDLDQASTRHPIVIKRVCLHTAVANTLALKRAEIGHNFDFGQGGKVELDQEGQPNGILREQATKIFDELIPDPTKIPEVKKDLMKKAMHKASSEGITSIHTYAADIWKYTEDFDDYLAMERRGELPLRVTIYLDTLYDKPFLTRKALDDPYRKVQYGGYKIFCDGSLGSRSAKLYEPYTDDPSTDGILVQSPEELNEKMYKAYAMGLQPATHCIGDRALELVVDAIEYTLKKSREQGMTEREQRDRLPFRIIHAQLAKPDQIDRMAKLPVVLDIQPTFYCTDLHWIHERVGTERAKNGYRWNTYVKNGLMLTGGSDAPVEDFRPFIGIYAAVTRCDLNGCPESPKRPEEKLSVYDAISLYTRNVPYATGEEAVLGTLEVNKFADMAVLDRDPFQIPEEDLYKVEVLATYLAGKEVYRR